MNANVGTTTIPFARRGFRVVAIGPVPTTLRYLWRNVEMNGLAGLVDVVEAAVRPTANRL